MNKYLYILISYLKRQGYFIEKKLIKQRLYSDPDNGILPITNTLDFFNVKNIVANVPKTSFDQIPLHFICQVNKNEQYNLVLVDKTKANKIRVTSDKNKSVVLSKEEFLQHWTGIIIAIEKNEELKNSNRNTSFYLKIGLSSFLLLLVISFGFNTQSFLKTTYLIVSVLGLFISYLIIDEKLGDEPSKFCTISESTNCNSVLNSKESKLLKFIDLSDASIIYFSFIILSFIYDSSSIIYFVLPFLSLPVIGYSIYSQKYLIKKWCPLCLAVGIALILQLTIKTFIYESLHFSYLSLILFCFILTLIIIGWYQLKELLIVKQQNDSLLIENMSFRRNHNLFLPYHNSISEINTDENIIADISFGNAKAVIKILAITNPLCELCFETHNMLMELLKKHKNQICIKFRFFIPYENQDDPKTQIAERLLDLYINDRVSFKEAYGNWYSVPSVNQWLSKWGTCTDEKVKVLIRNQVIWCLKNNINYTPTILINGKQFPSFYHPNDIPNFITKMIV